MIENKKDMHKNIATSIEKLKEEIDFFKRNYIPMMLLKLKKWYGR